MSLFFDYKSNRTLEVFNGVFYSPDHDPELNRDPAFLANLDLPQIHPWNLISLVNVQNNNLLTIKGVLTYPDGNKVDIDDFQSSGVDNLISSNEDSVELNFSCKSITSSNFDSFDWQEDEEAGDGLTMKHELIHRIKAIYREQGSDILSIPIKITNQLPTCRPVVVFNGNEIGTDVQVNIDLGSESFTIRLTGIDDLEVPRYLEEYILEGSVVNLEKLRKLVMFKQKYGTNQIIESLDIVGFSLAATTSGTGGTFVLNLTYTLDSGVVVPAVNKIDLILIDPLDLQRPASNNDMVLYNIIPDIVTVTADASTPVVSPTAVGEYIEIKGERYNGFDPTIEILEKQPNDGNDKPYIDIPMSIALPNGATMIRITPSTELSGDEHHWNKWSDPQDGFIIIDHHGDENKFDDSCDIIDNNGMHDIDIVFRILQRDYWNGDFKLSLEIDSYKEEYHQGEVNYELPYVISIKPVDSKVLIT